MLSMLSSCIATHAMHPVCVLHAQMHDGDAVFLSYDPRQHRMGTGLRLRASATATGATESLLPPDTGGAQHHDSPTAAIAIEPAATQQPCTFGPAQAHQPLSPVTGAPPLQQHPPAAAGTTYTLSQLVHKPEQTEPVNPTATTTTSTTMPTTTTTTPTATAPGHHPQCIPGAKRRRVAPPPALHPAPPRLTLPPVAQPPTATHTRPLPQTRPCAQPLSSRGAQMGSAGGEVGGSGASAGGGGGSTLFTGCVFLCVGCEHAGVMQAKVRVWMQHIRHTAHSNKPCTAHNNTTTTTHHT